MQLSPLPLIAVLLVLAGLAPFEEPSAEATAIMATAPATAARTPLLADTIVIPGERVGPITRATTREDLASLFGEDRLSDEPVHVGEGFTEPGTVVDLGPEQSFTVIWEDSDRTRPGVIRDFGPAWETPEGIGVGVSFNELKTILGSFQLYGLGWDCSGALVLEGSGLAEYNRKLVLRVSADQEAIEENLKAYYAVANDTLFPSDDPNLDLLDLKVEQMTVFLNREGLGFCVTRDFPTENEGISAMA